MSQARTTPQRSLMLAPLDEQPLCTIVIPCLNEEGFIEVVVRGAMEQRYPRHLLEILVADGGSTDRTRAIVARLAAEDARVALVDNPGRFPSAGMNEGIRRASGAVIVRMDAHAEYAADYVLASVQALRRTGAANVGGAARARSRHPFQRALTAALASALGVGGSAYRDPSREGFVESVFNGAFRREAFDCVGLYDATARTNEDAELNQRIIEAGGSVYLSRDVVAFYYPRSSLGAMARQYFSYGHGRARTLLRRGRLLSIRPLVPFVMVTLAALSAVLAALWPAAAPFVGLVVALYAAFVILEAIRLAAATELRLLPLIAVIFPVMHAAHGLGVWDGLARNALTKLDPHAAERRVARMLPLHLAMWDSDLTVRGAVDQQLHAGFTGGGASSLMTGGELTVDTRAVSELSALQARVMGRYAHVLGIASGADTGPPGQTMAFGLTGDGSFQVGPRTHVQLGSTWQLASRFGVRALESAIAVDPFVTGNRLAYSAGGTLGLAHTLTKRTILRSSAGYLQEGGLAADLPEAVGVDAHTARAEASVTRELGLRDGLTPELRYAYTHFYHAIYDVTLRRGPADVQATTAALGEAHAFSRRLTGTVSAGVTAAYTALPGAPGDAKIAPDLRMSASYLARRARLGLSYGYAYTSLGARLGYGDQHSAMAQLSVRPLDGARWRDLVLHATARAAYGTAPIALAPGQGAGQGTLTTTTLVTGGLVEVPLLRGLAFTGGVDLAFTRGSVAPAPPLGAPSAQLEAIAIVGLAWTLSTDRARTVRPDPQEEEEAARVAAEPYREPSPRDVDRARRYRPREGDATDFDDDREEAPPPEP